MVESENVPTNVFLKDNDGEINLIKDFSIGQNTMMIQDVNNDLYMTGLKLNYEPKKLNFD